jgi:hypothetical protein
MQSPLPDTTLKCRLLRIAVAMVVFILFFLGRVLIKRLAD